MNNVIVEDIQRRAKSIRSL